MERQTITVEELAEALGVGRNMGYDLVRTRKVRSVRLGRRIVVPRTEVDRLLAGEALAGNSQLQQDGADAA